MLKAERKVKRAARKIVWTGNRPPMKHRDFLIGREFLTPAGRWRCTDVGARVITAIKLDMDHDPSWYNGLPYVVAESVFDEYDFEGCEVAPKRRSYDDSGGKDIQVVRTKKPRKCKASWSRGPVEN
jgi:hypothetical protein